KLIVSPYAIVNGHERPPAVATNVSVSLVFPRIAIDETAIAEAVRASFEQCDEVRHLFPLGRCQPAWVGPNLRQKIAAADVHHHAVLPPRLANPAVPFPIRQPDAKRIPTERRDVFQDPASLIETPDGAIAAIRRGERGKTGALDPCTSVKQGVGIEEPPWGAITPIKHDEHILRLQRAVKANCAVLDCFRGIQPRQMLVLWVIAFRIEKEGRPAEIIKFQQLHSVVLDLI